MKLLIISLHADPTSPAGIGEGGGTHSYVRELLTFFSNTNNEILLITRKSHPSLPNYEQISNNCKIRRIIIKDEYPMDKKKLYFLHKISLQNTEHALKDSNFIPDLIHSIYWNSGQVAKELSDKLKIPYVHTVISNGLRRKITGMSEMLEQRYAIEKEIFKAATYIFCITPSERMDLVNLYQINVEKVMVLGRPVSADFIYPAHDEFGIPYRFMVNTKNITTKSDVKLDCNLTSNLQCNTIGNDWWAKHAFLYCGRISSNKGIDVIIKAWCCLKQLYNNSCPALWIAGGNLNEIQNFKSGFSEQTTIEKYEESGDLIWWGYLDQRGLSTLMLKSHALIMHSSYEPGGRVIIEALSSGIPVIATPYGFGCDYIHNWYNGFQVPFGNTDYLYYVLSLFIKQPYLSNMLGLNAKKYMKKVLKSWNFYESHQIIYDNAIVDSQKNFEHTGLVSKIETYKNYLNTYPYFNNIITRYELELLLKEKFQKDKLYVKPIFSGNSAIWITKINSIEYEILQPYTMLRNDAYYYPFIDSVVDTRSNLYEREKFTSSLSINPIKESIDEYYIIIKENGINLKWEHLQKAHIHKAIRNLLNEIEMYHTANIQNKLNIFNNDWHDSSIDEIKETYAAYYKLIPACLYHSHAINLSLSIRQLYFILTNSYNILSEDIVRIYNECKTYLYRIASANKSHYGECIENCSIHNIVFNNITSKCLFKSASTLYWGDTSKMLAGFLHDYLIFLLSENSDLSNLDLYINAFVTCQRKEVCIGWLFVITFEKIAFYLNTLQEAQFENEYILLYNLKTFYIDNGTTS